MKLLPQTESRDNKYFFFFFFFGGRQFNLEKQASKENFNHQQPSKANNNLQILKMMTLYGTNLIWIKQLKIDFQNLNFSSIPLHLNLRNQLKKNSNKYYCMDYKIQRSPSNTTGNQKPGMDKTLGQGQLLVITWKSNDDSFRIKGERKIKSFQHYLCFVVHSNA